MGVWRFNPSAIYSIIYYKYAPSINFTFTFMHLADAFIQRDLFRLYIFFVSMCVPRELNPQPFALLTQCSTTEPEEHFCNFAPKALVYCNFVHDFALHVLLSQGSYINRIIQDKSLRRTALKSLSVTHLSLLCSSEPT